MGVIYQADIKDVVRNYELRNNDGFKFCLFEAVSNALYACMENSKIEITIHLYREYKSNALRSDGSNFVRAFDITDNGIGFDDANFGKFTKSIYKTNHEGGKGLGRIAFLKVFSDVSIDSTYMQDGTMWCRRFQFNVNDIADTNEPVNRQPLRTVLSFRKMREVYKKGTDKDIEQYVEMVLEHFYVFLTYLNESNRIFEIKFIDESGKISDNVINNEKLSRDKITKECFTMKDTTLINGLLDDEKGTFEIVHIKSRNLSEHKSLYVVDERSAGDIPGIELPPSPSLEDEDGFIFHYCVCLKSPYFSTFLNESRTLLTLPRKNKNTSDTDITEERIKDELQLRINKFLSFELGILNQKAEENVRAVLEKESNNVVYNNKAYMYILEDVGTKEELLNRIRYSDTDKTILVKIRNFHEEMQSRTIKQINETISKLHSEADSSINLPELEAEVNQLTEQLNTQNLINLSSYIMYRKYVLNLFYEGLAYYKRSKQYNEAFFHNLLLPRQTSNTSDSNMWLIDDSFLYYEGISEVKIEDIQLHGDKLIRELNEEEQEQIAAFNKKRMERRIDLLFFPDEKKCILMELKDPKIGVGDNVLQMDRYARMIANFLKPEYAVENFYTYLITDHFNKYDTPSGYHKIYGIEGFVRTSIDIKKYDADETIANQYSEVIRSTDIYDRAYRRNQVYFSKLGIHHGD